ncbi:MAG TPA: ATP-binding protein [Polyangiaceae bacterium]|nr:ATP-binding protein [Polyangiaceae bacterium]
MGVDETSLAAERAFESGQREVLELIASGAAQATLLEQIVRLIEAQSPGMICSILLLDREQGRLRTGSAPHLPPEFMRAINGARIGPKEGSCGSAAYRGVPVIVDDIATHEYWQNYRQLALPHGLRACWSTPIFSASQQVLGTFAMYFKEPRSPGALEQHWVDRATHIAAIALQRGVDEAKLRLHAHIHNVVSSVIFYLSVEPDEQYRFLSVNPAFGAATGLDDEQVLGHLVSEVIPEPSLSKVLGYYRQAIAERHTVRWLEISPYPTGTKYGQVSIAPVFGSDGACTNLIGTVHDVTEQHLAQERLFHAQRLESLGTLVGGIAHDFNNILMAISCNALLAKNEPTTLAGQAALAQIEQATSRGADLVRQLMTFSRQQDTQRSVIDLSRVAEEAVSLMRATLPRNIQQHTEYANDVPQILADPTQIHQIVINLIRNATQAMEGVTEGGGLLSVSVDSQLLTGAAARSLDLSPGSYARLRVSDTGQGMTETMLHRIFDPFFTTKEPGIGTGLGLAVVHGIIKAHGGAIAVTSTVGKGSTFEAYFPAAATA